MFALQTHQLGLQVPGGGSNPNGQRDVVDRQRRFCHHGHEIRRPFSRLFSDRFCIFLCISAGGNGKRGYQPWGAQCERATGAVRGWSSSPFTTGLVRKLGSLRTERGADTELSGQPEVSSADCWRMRCNRRLPGADRAAGFGLLMRLRGLCSMKPQ
eukprot:3882701-Rhodomonas_salina.2